MSTDAQHNNEPTLTPELTDLFKRAATGDEDSLRELKKAFDENPELAAYLGNLRKHAETSLIRLAAGENVVFKEAIMTQVAELRQRLQATAPSNLEKLLVDRIVLSWIAVHHCELEVAQHLRTYPGNSPLTAAAVKRLGSANHRYLASVKSLAQVQKLLSRAPSPIQIATRMNEASSTPSKVKRQTTIKHDMATAN